MVVIIVVSDAVLATSAEIIGRVITLRRAFCASNIFRELGSFSTVRTMFRHIIIVVVPMRYSNQNLDLFIICYDTDPSNDVQLESWSLIIRDTHALSLMARIKITVI